MSYIEIQDAGGKFGRWRVVDKETGLPVHRLSGFDKKYEARRFVELWLERYPERWMIWKETSIAERLAKGMPKLIEAVSGQASVKALTLDYILGKIGAVQ